MVSPLRRVGTVSRHIEDGSFDGNVDGVAVVFSYMLHSISKSGLRRCLTGGGVPSYLTSSAGLIGSSFGGSSWTGVLGLNFFFSAGAASAIVVAVAECRFVR